MTKTCLKPTLWRNAVLSIIVTVFFLWLALRDVDLETIKDVFTNMHFIYLPLPFIAWGVGMIARATRWHLLLDRKIGFVPTTHIINIGFLINATIPLRIGEVLRVYLVSQQKGKVSGWTTLTTIGTERILDTLAVVVLLVVVLPFLPISADTVLVSLIFGFMALGGFLVLLLFAHKPAILYHLLNLIQRFLPFLKKLNLEGLLDRLSAGVHPLANWHSLVTVLFWTGVAWLGSLSAAWATALLFNELVPQTDIIRAALTLTIVATSFSVIVPFTMASVGPFETAVIFALGTIGIGEEIALAYGIVFHAAMVVHFVVWGSTGVIALGLSFAEISQVRDMQDVTSQPDAAQ